MGRRRLRHPQHGRPAEPARARTPQRRGADRDPRVARDLPVDAADQARLAATAAGCPSRSAATTPAPSASSRRCAARRRTVGPGDILAEIQALVDDGAIEVTLLGQNVNSYGVEFGDRQAFGKLLRAAGRDRRPGAHPLHQPAPGRVHRRRDRRDGRDAVGDAAAAHAAAVRLRPHPARRCAAPTAPRSSSASSTACGPSSRTRRSAPTSSSASPARPRRTSRRRCASSRPRGSPPPSPSSTRSARARRRRRWPIRCRRRSCRSATSGSSPCRSASPSKRTEKVVGREVELLVANGEGRKDADTHRLSGRAGDSRLVHFEVPAGSEIPRPGDVVTVTVTQAAPFHLIADAPDGAPLAIRRTRAGDAWDRAEAESCAVPAHGRPARPRPGVSRSGCRRCAPGEPLTTPGVGTMPIYDPTDGQR